MGASFLSAYIGQSGLVLGAPAADGLEGGVLVRDATANLKFAGPTRPIVAPARGFFGSDAVAASTAAAPLNWTITPAIHSVQNISEKWTDPNLAAIGHLVALELDPSANTTVPYYSASWHSLKTKVGNTRDITDTINGAVGEVWHQGSGTAAYLVGGTHQVFAMLGSPATRISGSRIQAFGGATTRGIDLKAYRTSAYGGAPVAGICDGISLDLVNTWAVNGGSDATTGFSSLIQHSGATNATVTTRGFYSRITSAPVVGGSSTAVDYFAEFRTTDANYGFYQWFNGDAVWAIGTDGRISHHNPGFTKFTAGSANHERAEFRWDANVWTIGTTGGGSGAARDVRFVGPEFAFGSSAVFDDQIFTGWTHKNIVNIRHDVPIYQTGPALNQYSALMLRSEVDASQSAANNENVYPLAIRADIKAGNAQNHGALGCWSAIANHNGSGTLASLNGGYLFAFNNGPGTVTNLIGWSVTANGGSLASGANTTNTKGLSISASSGVNVSGAEITVNKLTTSAGSATAGTIHGLRNVVNNNTAIGSGTDTTVNYDSVVFREGAVGGTIYTHGFRSYIRNDGGGTSKWTVDYLALEPASLVGNFSDRYQLWFENPGIVAIPYFTGGSEIWHFNPGVARYVTGAANYERCQGRWSGSVYQFGPVKGGTGVLRGMQLTGEYIAIGGGTTATPLRFLEPSGSGAHYVSFVAPSLAADNVYTWPAALPAVNGYSLTCTTGGVMSWTNVSGGGGGGPPPDGDYGDITVSSSGSVWTIDPSSVTYAKIQNVSATDKLLGRMTAGAGVVEEIPCTAAGRAILDDADAPAQRVTLGLGTAATASSGDFAPASHNHDSRYYTETESDALLAAKADLVGGLVPTAQIPAIAITEYLGTAANQAAMLALAGQKGDWCTRTDLGTSWIITGNDPTQLSSWTQLSYPAAPVTSVNSQTGAVVLGAGDVGAVSLSGSYADPSWLTALAWAKLTGVPAPVTNLSGTNTGDVTLAGSPNYLTIAGQAITRALIDLTTHVTGDLPLANLAQASAASRLLGRGSAAGAGDYQAISLGSGLSMSGTTLAATIATGSTIHDLSTRTPATTDLLLIAESTTSTGSITGATTANPVVITATSHGLSNGNQVWITGVVGMTEINDLTFTVANVTANTFELSGINGTGYTPYTSGGTWLYGHMKKAALSTVATDALLTTSDVTTNNATSSKHGFCPKLSNVSTEYLSGTGVFSTPAGGSGILPRGHISGLELSNNGTDANNDIDIAIGEACSTDVTADRVLMELTSGLTKRLDAAWAVGTNQGGLDTGAEANSTWYYVWLIKRTDTGVVDVLFSTSASSPTMPANYTKKRRIGAVYNNASGNIDAFTQVGETFHWSALVDDLNTTSPATTWTLNTMSVPRVAGVEVKVSIVATNTSTVDGTTNTVFCAPGNMNAPAAVAYVYRTSITSKGTTGSQVISSSVNQIPVSSSGQIRYAANTATTIQVLLRTGGWVDHRDRHL